MSAPTLTADSIRRFLVLCCLVGALVAVGGCFSGCATQNAPGRILATTAQTVDSAMQAWASYVALERATPAQESAVRALYAKYQAAESAAQNAYVAGANTSDPSAFAKASAELRAAQTDLLNLVNLFNPPKPTP